MFSTMQLLYLKCNELLSCISFMEFILKESSEVVVYYSENNRQEEWLLVLKYDLFKNSVQVCKLPIHVKWN